MWSYLELQHYIGFQHKICTIGSGGGWGGGGGGVLPEGAHHSPPSYEKKSGLILIALSYCYNFIKSYFMQHWFPRMA